MIECRAKCPALIHECRTYNIFYPTTSDVRWLFRSLRISNVNIRTNLKKFFDDKLPDRYEFFSSLIDERISEKDYLHAINV